MSGLRDLVTGGDGGCDAGGGGASSSSDHQGPAYPANPLGAFADALLRRGDGGGAVAVAAQQQQQHPVALAQRQRQPYAAASAEALCAAALAPPPLAVPGVSSVPPAAALAAFDAAASVPPWAAVEFAHHQRPPNPDRQLPAGGSWAGEFSSGQPLRRRHPQFSAWAEQFSAPPPPSQQQHYQHQHKQQQQQQQPRFYQTGGGGGYHPTWGAPLAASGAALDPGAPPPPPPPPAPAAPPSAAVPARGPTPAERRAARGPHRDDPLEDAGARGGESFGPNAGALLSTSAASDVSAALGVGAGGRHRRRPPPTWVRQFNEALADALVNGTSNAGPTLEAEAEAVGALAPPENNPFVPSGAAAPSSHVDPLSAAREAAERGLPGAAALALEACVRRSPMAPGTWHALGLARADLGDGPGVRRACDVSVFFSFKGGEVGKKKSRDSTEKKCSHLFFSSTLSSRTISPKIMNRRLGRFRGRPR